MNTNLRSTVGGASAPTLSCARSSGLKPLPQSPGLANATVRERPPRDWLNAATRSTALGVALALSVAVIAGCSGQANENAQPPPPEVSVAAVLVKRISQWDDFSGRVRAVESVDLRPRVSGYIERVNYREGQEVEKGEVLFTIDSRSYRAELARAQADLARARSQAQLGRSEAARALKLS